MGLQYCLETGNETIDWRLGMRLHTGNEVQ